MNNLILTERNIDKCHLLVNTNTVTIKVGNFDLNYEICEKFLGFKFDQRLAFDDQTSDVCKIYELWRLIDGKLYALARITPYMNFLYWDSFHVRLNRHYNT